MTLFKIQNKTGKVYSADEVEDGQTLYCPDHYGAVFELKYDKDYCWHNKAIEQGNMFWDEQSAEEEAKRREVYHVVEKYSYRFSKEEWEDENIDKLKPVYKHNEFKISHSYYKFWQGGELLFKSKEDIQKAIEEVGKEDFIKYYLGVNKQNNNKIKEFKLEGCVNVPHNIKEDDIIKRFIEFVEENGWSFGGGVKEVDENE